MAFRLLKLTVLSATMLTAALAHAALSSASENSAMGSTALSAGVSAVPVSIIAAGSEALGAGVSHVYAVLSQQTTWTVNGITEDGDKTLLTLSDPAGKTQLKMAAPTEQARKTRIALRDTVTAERLGRHSFSLKHGGTVLGVMNNPQGGLSHSKAVR